MLPAHTVVCARHGRWWIGWVEEVPGVNAQERTKSALRASLREIMAEALEFNRQDSQAAEGAISSEKPPSA
ncbi:MAG: type II toxin-antitoxin system HicB family antitoxin [Verrucomicrobiaceae bacterium]|nr:MAG: type II toxin-antitoxin system HicB family antitoxin [Verrucomicrobiaceae bacterium]